ncbi:MAG: LuxR C-terminal-related transcriptional regulator [Anaerolineaceae bacterium]|nr:LuxR C-terminal-related transcriptional regulator [Anaerolineaceae bacterium]
MLDSLISTKLHNPLTIGRLTFRPRLDSRLDESLKMGSRLVLVTAPAGFGKSTLVSAWLKYQKLPFSWLSLDNNDNDPKQFLSYLVGALHKIDESLGTDQYKRIQTADSSDREAVYMDVMAHIINEIASLSISFLLVIDDCHLLKDQLILRIFNFLIEHQPSQMNLILISREDLPIPIARLRVRRQFVEIRQSDLQFSTDEAEDFLKEGMGIAKLTRRDIQALEHRTEGWVAGLQLAGLSIKSDPDPAKFIKSFTGSDLYILDYLLEEVFKHQPAEIQTFLLATSILPRFCEPLCDFILQEMDGISKSDRIQSKILLKKIEQSNLFLIPLDHKRQWFRYHHLFADLLRHSLSQIEPEKVPGYHLRASQWFELNGFIQEAVEHAFQAQDWIYAAELVERHAWNTILHSQVGTVSDWCRNFPEKIISKRQALCIFHGWALIIAFKKDDFPAARIRIEQAESTLSEIGPDAQIILVPGAKPVNMLAWVTGQLTLLRSFILTTEPRKQVNPQVLVDLGQQAYDQLPPEDITGLSVSLLDICYASQARSDAEDAEKKFHHVVGVAISGGNYFGAIVAEYHRAHGLLSQGRLRETIAFCQQKKKEYKAYFENPIQELPALALLDQALGRAYLELNELSLAEQLLRSGLEVGQWMPREEVPGYLALARLCYFNDDIQGIYDSLRRLEMRWPDIVKWTQAIRILYDLKLNQEDSLIRRTVATWAHSNIPEIGPDIVIPGIGPVWNDESDHAVYSAWVQIQIILCNTTEALGVVEPMLKVAVENKLFHRVIYLSLQQAQAYYVQGQKERAWKALQIALSNAESNGYLNIVDRNPILIRMLIEAKKLRMAPNYIQKILEIDHSDSNQANSPVNLDGIQPKEALIDSRDGLVEPLSIREIEVLALLAQGLSNAEIATRLYLSPNTLKSHTQNIFGKLGVHSRVQAVNKARLLNLIK